MRRRHSRGGALIAVLFLLLTIQSSRGQERVTIRLTQPPPNQLRIGDLWKIDLDNQSGRALEVYLHGTAEETSIPDGIIADARTKVFTLQPGRTRITGNDVQPVTVDESNPRYRDALLQTGSVPTGDYTICCEVILAENDQVLGRDCKFVIINRLTIPILITPPDESDVAELLPVFSWMPSMPPGPGQRISYDIRVVEIFGKQTPADAIARNPAWFEQQRLPRVTLQYPVSARRFQPQQRYAWKIAAFEDGARARIPLGESEIWSFTYMPSSADNGGDDDDGDGRDDTGRDTTSGGGGRGTPVIATDDLAADIPCPGENWDFELGTLSCWTVDGTSFVDDPVKESHAVLGTLGHHAKYWVTSLGAADGDAAMGSMLSQEFQIKHSVVSFLVGGSVSPMANVELLVERLAKDTVGSMRTRKLAGSSKEFLVLYSTDADERRGTSDRLVPVDWDVVKYLNRAAYILIRDSSQSAHINVDYFTFHDAEKDDTVKLPVLVLDAGENHALVATPPEKLPVKIREQLTKDITTLKGNSGILDEVNVIDGTSTQLKSKFASAAGMQKYTSGFTGATSSEDEPDGPEYQLVDVSPEIMKKQSQLSLAMLPRPNIVWGWGDNLRKSVAKPYGAVVPVPSKIAKATNVQSLASGMDHSLAVTQSGDVLAWGYNDYWQLGTDSREQKSEPVSLGLADIVQVAAGSRHSLALSKKGDVYVWGYNRTWECGTIINFELSTPATASQIKRILHIPKPLKHGMLKGIRQVAAGHSHSVALSLTGNVYTWGNNDHGQCGFDDDTAAAIWWPVLAPVGGPSTTRYDVIAVSAGDQHTMALGKDGRVWTWGGNASGQLGDGTTKDRHQPMVVQGLPKIKAISAGGTFSLALDSTGTVWAWGNNVLGQLGDGSRVGRFTPVKISRLDAVVGLSAGSTFAMAVRADGGLWSWGTHEYGQLGEGPITNLTAVPLDPPLGPIRVERLATP